MSNRHQRRLTAPMVVLLACLLATATLTLLFAVAPELGDDVGGNPLFWLAAR